jgi:hypothetical protein
MTMAVTCRASLSLLASLPSSNPAQSRRSLLMAASRSSHVGGSRDLLAAKQQRLSSASSAKPAVASAASSPGATSQGELHLSPIGAFVSLLLYPEL